MIKVSIEYTNIKEEVIIDPYIPIQVKFGKLDSWDDNRHYVRFGDLKYTMLEVGFLADSGVIRSVTLVSAKDITVGKEKHFNVENCEEGIIVFRKENLENKNSLDIISELIVTTYDNEIVINFGDDVVVKFVQNGNIKFGLNKLNELCCFVVNNFTDEKMKKLNSCLEYMLEY